MFQNSYQNGTYFELFDPKTSQDKTKLLYKMTNIHNNNKVFDKELKTFVFEFGSPNAKICFPKEQKKELYLIQQYLVFQIYFFPGMSWNIELVISDLTKTKRRIILSPSTHKTEQKPFFVKTPCHAFKEGTWNNMVVDLYSYVEAFKGQTYRSLDCIYMTGHFKLRRIYSTTTEPTQNQGENQSQEIKTINFLPKNYYFPLGVQYTTKINKFCLDNISEQIYEPAEMSTKNSSFLKKSKPKVETKAKSSAVKTEKIIKQQKQTYKIKEFLSNTNGGMINRKKKSEVDKSQSQTSHAFTIEENKSKKGPISIDKTKQKKKQLIKTQEMPPKARSSIDKSSKLKMQEKSKMKAKLNPWRSNQKSGLTDNSQLEISKHEEDSHYKSNSMFKTKNGLASRIDKKNENFSDSEYVELSQKFSTLTDGKFFKVEQQPISHQHEQKHDQQQIEENIEMETNSMYSSSNKKQQAPQHEHIIQSIADSLDKSPRKKPFDELGRSSLYGFGQKLMKKFMGEIERPYSPPLGEREMTEEDAEHEHVQNQEKDEVELIYDPVLNCYYDHKTHTYYELKN